MIVASILREGHDDVQFLIVNQILRIQINT